MTHRVSELAKRVEPVGRILALEDWYVWGSSAIDGPDGNVHLFSARWPAETGMGGWSTHSEIIHSVSQSAGGPFDVQDVALQARPGRWDGGMVHNPTIHRVGDRYALVHIGNRDGRPFTQSIGIAVSDSLDGPWKRSGPVLRAGQRTWDWLMATNPALLVHPDGRFWLYYKSWDLSDKKRKVGLAIADDLLGPYEKHPDNPLVDYSDQGKQIEDPYVYIQDGRIHMVLADDNEGVVKQHAGAIVHSDDGIHFSEPELAYDTTAAYSDEPIQRFERPQVLMRKGRPAYLYLSAKGGPYGTATSACLRINW